MQPYKRYKYAEEIGDVIRLTDYYDMVHLIFKDKIMMISRHYSECGFDIELVNGCVLSVQETEYYEISYMLFDHKYKSQTVE